MTDRDTTELWTLGLWTAKPGNEQAFATAWRDFAAWTAANQAGTKFAYLLQDTTEPRRFISLGPWETAAAIDAWRSTPEFQAFLARARELCEELRPNTLRPVARVGGPGL